ncbi:hypothetical protein H112_03070 [Trichophyton rubrum D6]|uniref:Uncharacterized protein n=3 Tax=Trichophyton TaxID=5550 RepID=A0A080WK95_TRIRC|nr:uncharacterized protein TERG_12324 [Trichophyton rubrum CBS 118892]EZF24468.1 hypothetical protein H100_03076 [Trichophyton rubrum MR850]EZF43504.1 hypothetical protein H102_03069 [Trichophyton rubrum CBS 100081]EZF54146.1 hypothetical protein H103_03083 [Trichophyton rubrum CBS 288.86]EZF64764.1 hypothetical protein H104_03063 [Trichophyton rubrum CBS 289.86]EZF75390.1 hypothetical protein H105_03087 [Trichophyton soudanense CBS 452.61]EZF86126.1 hypothetical protein H110_03076 [Trichophy
MAQHACSIVMRLIAIPSTPYSAGLLQSLLRKIKYNPASCLSQVCQSRHPQKLYTFTGIEAFHSQGVRLCLKGLNAKPDMCLAGYSFRTRNQLSNSYRSDPILLDHIKYLTSKAIDYFSISKLLSNFFSILTSYNRNM